MKKFIISVVFIMAAAVSFGQTYRTLSGFDPTTGRGGYIYRDTLISLPYTSLKYVTGYGTFGSFNDSVRAAITGTSNRITVTTGVVDISASYVGQSSITTHGTITSGGLGTGAVIGGVTMTLGSDATGDMYFRNSSGILARIAAGATGTILRMGASSVPAYTTATFPSTAGSSGDVLTSDGTNWSSAAPAVSATSTTTFSNKRWTPRVGSTTSSATPTINTDNYDIYKLTAQTADVTSFSTNLSGTPVDGDILEIQITGTAARALTFGASFVSSTVTIPTTTVTTVTLTIVFQYFTTSSYGNNKWVCFNYF